MRGASIRIVSPAQADANNGNARTASRWARFLRGVAEVRVVAAADDRDAATEPGRAASEPGDGELLIALHARHSAGAVARRRAADARAPIVVILTGTDLYRDLDHDASARHAVECASALVVLQPEALRRLDAPARAKATVIVQSAPALVLGRDAAAADFVAVGHLRDEKDPRTLFAAMRALRQTHGAASPTLDQLGAPLDRSLAEAAQATMAACPAYRWLGARPHAATRRAIAGARALVHPSRLEGGAHAVIEAVRSRVPVLASRIDGNVGLLGAGYAGYFDAGDAPALAALMARVRDDAAFAGRLAAQCREREPLFRPAAERAAVRRLAIAMLATIGA